jgi:radical SAM protein with 4Fe4S-binding SPASM domain
MTDFVEDGRLPEFPLWEKIRDRRVPLDFELELTARCNNNCRHCYINLPPNDRQAKAQELSLDEIAHIADQAVELGTMWVLITGGEPLLRHDFTEIYLILKRKGLLVSVFTNATLIRPEHIALFQKYPPRDIEVTIYGASQEVYERVSRVPGSFQAFQDGVKALFDAGIRVRFKAMALRSNLEEIDAIAAFGRDYTRDYYRFDPLLHLRFDGDENRNEEIRSERLLPHEIVALEQADRARFESMEKHHDKYYVEGFKHRHDNRLFLCGAGNMSFSVGYDGTFRLCSSLWAPGTTVNLREVSLRQAWEELVPAVRELRTDDHIYLEECGQCPIVNLCMNCPAHAHLELGRMDAVVPYFCQVAHARSEALQKNLNR